MEAKLFFELIQVALGNRAALSEIPTGEEWGEMYQKAEEQAVVGLTLSAIERLPVAQRPPKLLLLQWIGVGDMIRQRNALMDDAVVRLCKLFEAIEIKTFVFKGQTLAHLYPDRELRQSGDIDFFCNDEDWIKAKKWLREEWQVDLNDMNSHKDVEFDYEGVIYEMHRKLVLFSYPKHAKYWATVVMPEILTHPSTVKINDDDVPTLAPIYNVLYVFVHIFQHLISDGVGLRQLVDWMLLIKSLRWEKEDVDLIEKHLEGLGLKKAFIGLGAILTDYLGLAAEEFPFEISKDDHRDARKLIDNILLMGSFGHNDSYTRSSGVVHGIQHLWRIYKQTRLFGHYAPAEAWWKIPFMFKWWGQKMLLIARK